MRIPLAWNNLTHDWRRLAVSVAGIAFAVFLMFIELGFKNALIDSTIEVVNIMHGDLVMVSRARFGLAARLRFERERMRAATAFPEVADAYPVYVENVAATIKRVDKVSRPIRILAFDLDDPLFDDPEINQFREPLRAPKTGIIDRLSKKQYMLKADDDQQVRDYEVEINDQALRLAGAFSLGTDFAVDGNLIMSKENYARYFPYAAGGDDPLKAVDLGVIEMHGEPSEADRKKLATRINERLPDDVEILTRQQFIDREKAFWNRATPVGYIFLIGTIMGFVVGIIICYQIIFTDISDHMSELATLKAMGYDGWYFLRFVISESILLSIFGFIPGLIFSWLMYGLLASLTGLLLRLTIGRALMVFALTAVMCIASGMLAVRKVISMDPAELF
jgi:putative ABC transport system permease protein